MPAYIIVEFTPKDQEKLQQYGASVPPTLATYSGEILVKGPAQSLHGDAKHSMQVIIVFPSRENATSWYHSKAYQALIPLRNAGMDSRFQLVG